jgi:hypothetical protein
VLTLDQIIERRSRPLEAIREDDHEIDETSDIVTSSLAIHKPMLSQEEYIVTLDDITSTVFLMLVMFLTASMARRNSFSRKGNQRLKSKNFWIVFAVTSFVFVYFKMDFFSKV